jgi:hypothetical protein
MQIRAARSQLTTLSLEDLEWMHQNFFMAAALVQLVGHFSRAFQALRQCGLGKFARECDSHDLGCSGNTLSARTTRSY